MPLYHYRCPDCDSTCRRLQKSPEPPECCGGKMLRNPEPITSRSVEILDNGFMTRSLERLTDAERLFKDRAKATKKAQEDGPDKT